MLSSEGVLVTFVCEACGALSYAECSFHERMRDKPVASVRFEWRTTAPTAMDVKVLRDLNREARGEPLWQLLERLSSSRSFPLGEMPMADAVALAKRLEGTGMKLAVDSNR